MKKKEFGGLCFNANGGKGGYCPHKGKESLCINQICPGWYSKEIKLMEKEKKIA